MSDATSTGTENTGPAKKQVSHSRNIFSLSVLIVVIILGIFQYAAVIGFNSAVKALDARSQEEDKGLMNAQEAESLLGRAPDGTGGDYKEGNRTFTAKTYTWHGPLKSYTLTAFYTKNDDEPHLHHYESAGAKFKPEPVSVTPTVVPVAHEGKKEKKPAAAPAKPAATTAKTADKSSAPAPEPAKTADKSSAPAPEPAKTATTPAPAPAKGAEPAAAPSKPATASAPAAPKEPN